MTKERTMSIAATILFHAILLLCLLLYYVKPADKDVYNDELGGVPVMLGNASDAFGTKEPQGKNNGLEEEVIEQIETDLTKPNNISESKNDVKPNTPEVPVKKTSAVKKTPTPKTQDVEKTISTVDTKKQEADKRKKEAEDAARKQKQTAEAQARKQKQEAEKKAKVEEDKKKNINSQMAGLFGNGSQSGSKGNTKGSGTQGSPSGNSSTGKLSGVAGLGTYDLGGRGLGANGLILPSYTVDDYGTVVVDIIVDPQGAVIEATIGRGTTTANASLRNESLKAAKRTKFSTVKTSNNQRGTITYKFNLN